ncbi:hypothetical protein LN042_02155 [Kitasatospora sp. RB6PN24]|uniref:hypothetical protein n=1 Tax=Kitasatospora humi TaxID=2893891 RepID=UPI001E602697|nr:hypothetical protein [Kitasatospora humi]MCC9305920.1 hypothetical protein [Kitasatospora humi]
MLWLMLGVLGGYGLGAALTARVVFERSRAGFLDGAATSRFRRARALADFERHERHQVEVIALLSGVCWVVAVPVLVLKHAVTDLLFARPVGVPAERRCDQDVAERIDELERSLGIGAYAGEGSLPRPEGPPQRLQGRRPPRP